eukprot:gene12371-biopygen12725
MDDFLVLHVSGAEALRVREMVTKTLDRLGIDRYKKKGVWEPAELVEHSGLAVDTANGKFKGASKRIRGVQAGARHLLSVAVTGGGCQPESLRASTDGTSWCIQRSELLGPSAWDAVMFVAVPRGRLA